MTKRKALSTENCPTCGGPVRLRTSGEGTSSYEPVVEPLLAFARWMVEEGYSARDREKAEAALRAAGLE